MSTCQLTRLIFLEATKWGFTSPVSVVSLHPPELLAPTVEAFETCLELELHPMTVGGSIWSAHWFVATVEASPSLTSQEKTTLTNSRRTATWW